MSAPTFRQTDFLSIVHTHNPRLYADPVAYEFSLGRKFTKNDNNWYQTFHVPVFFGEEELTFGDEKLEF